MVWLADYEAWGETRQEMCWGHILASQDESYARVEGKVTQHEEKINLLKIEKEHLQPIRFQGQHFDIETGLHYNRFRYYDPDMGMFTTRDPIGLMGGNNVFQYGPNSTGFIDPLGLRGRPVTIQNPTTTRNQSASGYNVDFVKEVGRGMNVIKCGSGMMRPCGVKVLCKKYWCPGEPRNQCSSIPITRAIPPGMTHEDIGCTCLDDKIVREEEAP